MPRWVPEEKWKDEDVFIIGGGPSLEKFDYDLLKEELTIGCNTAYTLGPKVCKICIFGDYKWFTIFDHEIRNTKDIIFFSNCNKLVRRSVPYVWTLPREAKGLHYKSLGWNTNTGASAINLALILGARRIFLLGFDMQLSEDGSPNWHHRIIQKPKSTVYPEFIKAFYNVASDLKKKFPGRHVYNVTDISHLPNEIFPHIPTKEFWTERAKS